MDEKELREEELESVSGGGTGSAGAADRQHPSDRTRKSPGDTSAVWNMPEPR